MISSFLDGLAQNATTITRENVVAFATAPAGTGRAWQAFRLSTIRGFAAYVHGLDPEAAEVIPGRLLPAMYTRRIPYLYSAAQIRDLLTTSTVLLPLPLNLTMTAFLGLIAATGMRAGEAIALDSDDFDADQGLLTVTGKYGRQRVLPLHPSTVAALTAYRQARAAMTPRRWTARSSSAPPANACATPAPTPRSGWSPTPATCPPPRALGDREFMIFDIRSR